MVNAPLVDERQWPCIRPRSTYRGDYKNDNVKNSQTWQGAIGHTHLFIGAAQQRRRPVKACARSSFQICRARLVRRWK